MAPRVDRRSIVVVAVALFVSYAYFYQAGGWNQNSRFALVRAILERHTLRIDAYQDQTGDRAYWRGHYYSDKAPGASLLALLPVALAREAAEAVHVDPQGLPGIAWTSYVATLATSSLFTVVAALAVFRLSLAWGYSRAAALFAATAYGVATPAWCYATLFMEHGLTAGCLMLAYEAADKLSGPRQEAHGPEWRVGFWIGLAVVCELQAIIPATCIGVFALLNIRDRNPRAWPRAVLRIAAGGIGLAVVLFLYNTRAFGGPFHVGYASEESFDQLQTGLFGVTYPSAWRLLQILFGRYRGLVPLAPLVLATPIGLFAVARQPEHRRAAAVAMTIAAFYFLWNASYYYWEGGWAYSPRQVMPALPFLALGLAPCWDRAGRWTRPLLVTGWIWGAALTLVAVSTTPQPPAQVRWPMADLLWPAFRDGDLSLNNQTFVTLRADAGTLRGHPELHAAWNLGEVAGLHGRASLIPLGVVWVAAGALLVL